MFLNAANQEIQLSISIKNSTKYLNMSNHFKRSLLDLCKFAIFCWSMLIILSGKISRIIRCGRNVGRSRNVAFISARCREGKIAIHLWRLFSVSAATPRFEVPLLLVFVSAQILRIHDNDDDDDDDDGKRFEGNEPTRPAWSEISLE